jgi:phytoene dehydrogenase-like protein
VARINFRRILMADKEYDVVFVGGGQKAIVAAMYLTKYGHLKVGLFEERH